MRNRLPLYLENLDLPSKHNDREVEDKNYSYGYVSVMYLVSLIITMGSVLVIIFFGK